MTTYINAIFISQAKHATRIIILTSKENVNICFILYLKKIHFMTQMKKLVFSKKCHFIEFFISMTPSKRSDLAIFERDIFNEKAFDKLPLKVR